MKGEPAPERSHDDLQQWFDEILRTYGPALNRLAASYTRASGEREDLLQEIVFAIWRALPRFRGEASERTFLFRIAHNRALTHLAQRRPPTIAADEVEVEDAGPDPERAFSAQEEGERLLDAIRQLPIGYAQVITLTLEGMSYAEVADVLGISEANVGARLTRSRDMLRKLLRSVDDRR
jgi:RNA polymerase sigma factor (sigma-70 family)